MRTPTFTFHGDCFIFDSSVSAALLAALAASLAMFFHFFSTRARGTFYKLFKGFEKGHYIIKLENYVLSGLG
jgi:hypothetical protein